MAFSSDRRQRSELPPASSKEPRRMRSRSRSRGIHGPAIAPRAGRAPPHHRGGALRAAGAPLLSRSSTGDARAAARTSRAASPTGVWPSLPGVYFGVTVAAALSIEPHALVTRTQKSLGVVTAGVVSVAAVAPATGKYVLPLGPWY